MDENILDVNCLTKNYDDFKLENLSFSLPKGTIMGFIGENGAGKSTTIKLILDLIKADSGEISIFGKSNLILTDADKENIGVVFDECCIPEILNIKNITSSLKHIYKHWDSKTFEKYIEKFNLPLKKDIKDFSRGMKMKLDLAIALSHNAKLLILDEPTSGLDPIVRNEILDILLDFIQDESHSILLSSHITSDLEKICDYITFIHKGKLVLTEQKDILLDEYKILKCDENIIKDLDKNAIISIRKSQFSTDALVKRNSVPNNLLLENATLDDIMLYFAEEDR